MVNHASDGRFGWVGVDEDRVEYRQPNVWWVDESACGLARRSQGIVRSSHNPLVPAWAVTDHGEDVVGDVAGVVVYRTRARV